MRKHIALYGKTFCYSGGGIFVLSLIAQALAQKNQKLTLLLPEHLAYTPTKLLRKALGIVKKTLLKSIGHSQTKDYVDGRTIIKILKKADKNIQIVFHKDDMESLATRVKQIDADLILPAMGSLEKSFPIPWIGGVYDLQYKYYPEFFPAMNEKKIDKNITAMLQNTNTVLTISHNTKNDMTKFFPASKSTIIPMPLSVQPTPAWFTKDYSAVSKKYHLPTKYFLISNQLWIHKSHTTAFHALQTIRKECKKNSIHIICTGIMHDSRFPQYFKELTKTIADLNLTNYVHFLGHIPKEDQITIMRHSLGVIQPTLFEGSPGGGAAYDAIATDTSLIVSDIPVNLELKGEACDISFFKSGCADDLAEKMLELFQRKPREKKSPEQLIHEGKQRLDRLGDVLLDAIKEVCP